MKLHPEKVRVATYNIHKCVGLDRLTRPQRIVDVLRQINADIIGLQEVVSISGQEAEMDQARYIAEALGMEYRMGVTRTIRNGVYGNVLLSRFPFLSDRTFDLSHPGREERGCLHADIALMKGWTLHIYNLHLGTAYLERRRQARHVMKELMSDLEYQKGARILLGDFNDWTGSLPTKLFSAHFAGEDIRRKLQRRRTYPGVLPFLHLDHIYYDPTLILKGAKLYKSRKSLIASDHLPLFADFRLDSLSEEDEFI
jgi:endonuclease/exonuclease/phosphatase family metal-dependent hydrolase